MSPVEFKARGWVVDPGAKVEGRGNFGWLSCSSDFNGDWSVINENKSFRTDSNHSSVKLLPYCGTAVAMAKQK